MEWSLKIDCDTCKCGFLSQTFKIDKAAAAGRLFTWLRTLDHRTPLKGDTYIDCQLQWSAVRVTAVTVTVGYSDSFGNPRFITNKTPLLTVTKNRLQ